MKIRILFASCVAASLWSAELMAQRVPAGALPTEYNGGFAGEAGDLRLASFSYLDYGRFPHYAASSRVLNRGTFISADQFLKKIRSGVGFTIGRQGDDNRYESTAMSLSISPKFSVKGKYTIAPFADVSFSRTHYMQDPVINPADFTLNAWTIRTGFLLNTDNAYIGVTSDMFRDFGPAPGRFFPETRLSLQAGYTFQRTPESDFSFTPQVVLSYEHYDVEDRFTSEREIFNNINIVELNLGFRHKKFIAGINNTGLMLGYQNSKFKLQVTNFYWEEERPSTPTRISGNTYFRMRSGGMQTYAGCISLRCIFRKNPTVRMQGF
jgi:hypothetical protein